eukprot:UC1_evm1s2017
MTSLWGVSTGSNNILAHDPTPSDNVTAQVSPHAAYEPSTGQPRRPRFGRTAGFSRGGIAGMEERSSHLRSQTRRIRPADNPGTSRVASDFFSGMHSTEYSKNTQLTPFEARYEDRSTYQEKERARRQLIQATAAEAEAEVQSLRQRRQAELAREEAEKLAVINSSDGGFMGTASGDRPLVLPGERLGRVNQVQSGKVFQAGGEDSFVAQAMGRPGGGGALRHADGSIVTRVHRGVSTNEHHSQGPADAYAAQAFGRPGLGAGPTIGPDGNPQTRATRVVSQHKLHKDPSVPGGYYDKVFGRPAMGVRPTAGGGNGGKDVRMGRQFTVSQHRIHRQRQAAAASSSAVAAAPETETLFDHLGEYKLPDHPGRVSLDHQLAKEIQQSHSEVDPLLAALGHGSGYPPKFEDTDKPQRFGGHRPTNEPEFAARYAPRVTERGYRNPGPRSNFKYKPYTLDPPSMVLRDEQRGTAGGGGGGRHGGQQQHLSNNSHNNAQDRSMGQHVAQDFAPAAAEVPFTSPLQQEARQSRQASATSLVVDGDAQGRSTNSAHRRIDDGGVM